MIEQIFLIFFMVSFLCILPIKKEFIKWPLILVCLILIYFAAYRDQNSVNDYKIYLNFWNYRDIYGTVETSFVVIRDILKYYFYFDYYSMFFVFAFLGVSTKFYSISKLSPFAFYSVLIYIGHYFILHELTQIRIGVASGFFLIAIYFRIQKRILLTLIFLGAAIFFHYSTALGIIILFLKNKKSKLYYYLIPIGYTLYFLNTRLNINISIPYIQDKLNAYNEIKNLGMGDEINVYNAVFLFRIGLFYFLMFNEERLYKYYNGSGLLIKIYGLSLFMFLFLANIPAFSFRIQEFFGVVEIVLIPLIIYLFPKPFIGKIFVVLIAFIFLILDIYYNTYLI